MVLQLGQGSCGFRIGPESELSDQVARPADHLVGALASGVEDIRSLHEIEDSRGRGAVEGQGIGREIEASRGLVPIGVGTACDLRGQEVGVGQKPPVVLSRRAFQSLSDAWAGFVS